MIGVALRRLGWAIAVAWFAATVTFAVVFAIPGDPARVVLGPHATAETLAHARAHYHLDDGLAVQYGAWLGHVARGDLGESYRAHRPVTAILADRLWPTVQLALAAIVLQLALGVPLGILAAAHRRRWPDRLADVIGLLGQSAPTFVLGTVLLYVVSYRWNLLPFGGYGDGVVDRLRHLVLPALALAALGIAFYARLVRAELGDVLDEDYIRTARAKGLSETRVVLGHGLRSAAGPLVTLIGLDLGVLLGGAVVTEQIFQWPGLGRELLQAIFELDMPLVLGAVLVSALAIALANLVVDLVQLWLDPRLRG